MVVSFCTALHYVALFHCYYCYILLSCMDESIIKKDLERC